MREQKQLKKIAEQRLQPLCDDIVKNLEAEFPAPAAKSRKKLRWSGKLTAAALAFAAVAGYAAGLLCVFLIPGKEQSDVEQAVETKGQGYIVGNTYGEVSQYTIKEYNALNGTNILFLDGYDTAEFCRSYTYIYLLTRETCGIGEVLKKDGLNVMLRSEVNGSPAEMLAVDADKCTQTEQLDMCELKWCVEDNMSCGVFEYGERIYCVTLLDVADKEKLFEVVNELFL